MKQIIPNYRTGKLELAKVPVPLCPANNVLVKNIASLISIGTERSIIELGKKSLLGKAQARPDLVKRFVDKAKNEGLVKTFKEALGRLDNPTALGYSSAGIVVEPGDQVQEFCPGDCVACIGAGYASHAEYITIPPMLGCKIPDSVSFEEAELRLMRGKDLVVMVELGNGARLVMSLTDSGSDRLGVGDNMELRAGHVTIRLIDGSFYESENTRRVLRRKRINPMNAYQRMYRAICRKIAARQDGDCLESLRSTELMLLLEDELQAVKSNRVSI